MERVETYVGMSVYEWLFSKQAQNDMVGLAKLSAAMLGTSTICNGLSCVPTGPASMQVVINPGELYQLTSLEATVCGTLPQDTAHQVVKQGILLDAFTTASGALPAPASAGQSINYLIEAQYADSDVSIDPTTGTTPVVLQFYNSSNPTTPWSGPGGLGGTSNTFRKGSVSLQIKAGAAATTGSQVTPTPDSGWVGLWVVTVANGQTQILAGNITQYAGAPILPSSLLSSIQTGNLSYAVATGTANAHVVALTPALTQRVDGMVIRYKAPAANTGALTLNDGLGAVAVVGGAHAALQGGETTTNGDVWVQWNSSIGGGSYIMLDSSGGALQIAPATQSQHAVPMAQATGVVGSTRNGRMYVSTASATATYTADEIIVEVALGGVRYCLPNFNQTVSTSVTGIGGVVGAALTANGFAAIYAAFNPSTQAQGAFIVNANAMVPNIAAAPPAGWTATGLLAVMQLNASTQFSPCIVQNRVVGFAGSTVLSTNATTSGVYTSLSIAGAVPVNAISVAGQLSAGNSNTGNSTSLAVSGTSTALGGKSVGGNVATAGGALSASFDYVQLPTAQTIYYANSAGGGGGLGFTVFINKYEF